MDFRSLPDNLFIEYAFWFVCREVRQYCIPLSSRKKKAGFLYNTTQITYVIDYPTWKSHNLEVPMNFSGSALSTSIVYNSIFLQTCRLSRYSDTAEGSTQLSHVAPKTTSALLPNLQIQISFLPAKSKMLWLSDPYVCVCVCVTQTKQLTPPCRLMCDWYKIPILVFTNVLAPPALSFTSWRAAAVEKPPVTHGVSLHIFEPQSYKMSRGSLCKYRLFPVSARCPPSCVGWLEQQVGSRTSRHTPALSPALWATHEHWHWALSR